MHMHVSAESWVGSRSWQGEDRDKSLIYWVHFLVSQAVSNTPPPTRLTVQGQRGRNKRYGVRERGKNEVNGDREGERERER